MYIHRIILRDVRNFKHLDLTLYDTWTQQPLKSVLLTGPNGSGKTTLVRAIAELWGLLAQIRLRPEQSVLFDAGLVAVEFRDLIEEPIWFYFAGSEDDAQSFREQFSNRVRLDRSGRGFSRDKPMNEPIKQLLAHYERLRVNAPDATLLPNIVFLEAENRLLYNLRIPVELSSFPEAIYQWLVTYEPQNRRSNLEIMLRNHKIRDPEDFERIINQINSFLGDKALLDFDRNLHMVVRVDNTTHTLSELSSGEKQCLIMMFMVSRWLMPGGVVLIDEPDLHLHVSLQRHFIHELEKVVLEKGGQIIVTSHSPTLWEEYNERQRMNLGEQLIHEQTDRLE